MQKFQLELLFHIIGIGSASGLLFNGSSLYLISDNSNILYNYNINTKILDKTTLVTGANPLVENMAKKDKPDFEAITVNGDELYLFGSGSTNKRNTIAHINIKTKEVLPVIDATDLYLAMQDFSGINADNFNIEAAVNDGDTWYLFNRGNGPKGQNGVFTLTGNMADTSFQILYNPVKLPKINGAKSSFTDAVKVGNKLYFLAAAEKSNSTYEDGEVAGTLVGYIDIEKMKVKDAKVVTEKNKFEGITLYKENEKTLEFLLCEDTDSDMTESYIYKLTLNK
jgi:hypothetical protein